jgi:hypothetical protein
MLQGEKDCTCRFRETCHFFNIGQKNGHSLNLLDIYCVKWPEKCQIHEKRRVGAPVSITLWPAGKVAL